MSWGWIFVGFVGCIVKFIDLVIIDVIKIVFLRILFKLICMKLSLVVFFSYYDKIFIVENM